MVFPIDCINGSFLYGFLPVFSGFSLQLWIFVVMGVVSKSLRTDLDLSEKPSSSVARALLS